MVPLSGGIKPTFGRSQSRQTLNKGFYMYNKDPREIVARFDSVCNGTSRRIKKGEICIYYPSSKKVYHIESAQAQSYREWKQDLSFGYNY